MIILIIKNFMWTLLGSFFSIFIMFLLFSSLDRGLEALSNDAFMLAFLISYMGILFGCFLYLFIWVHTSFLLIAECKNIALWVVVPVIAGAIMGYFLTGPQGYIFSEMYPIPMFASSGLITSLLLWKLHSGKPKLIPIESKGLSPVTDVEKTENLKP